GDILTSQCLSNTLLAKAHLDFLFGYKDLGVNFTLFFQGYKFITLIDYCFTFQGLGKEQTPFEQEKNRQACIASEWTETMRQREREGERGREGGGGTRRSERVDRDNETERERERERERGREREREKERGRERERGIERTRER